MNECLSIPERVILYKKSVNTKLGNKKKECYRCYFASKEDERQSVPKEAKEWIVEEMLYGKQVGDGANAYQAHQAHQGCLRLGSVLEPVSL